MVGVVTGVTWDRIGAVISTLVMFASESLPVFPARSVSRKDKVKVAPTLMFPQPVICDKVVTPLLQLVQSVPLTEHCGVRWSLSVKVITSDPSTDSPVVGLVIATVGAVVSTVNELMLRVLLGLSSRSVTTTVQEEYVPGVNVSRVMVLFPAMALGWADAVQPPLTTRVPPSVELKV